MSPNVKRLNVRFLLSSSFLYSLFLITTVSALMDEYPVPIGFNMEGVHYWDRTMFFADRIKHAAIEHANRGSVNLDANGWPTHDCRFRLYGGIPQVAIEGDHKIYWEGQANSITAQNAIIVESSKTFDPFTMKGSIIMKVPPEPTDTITRLNITLTFSGTSNGVRNVKVMLPGHDTTDTFNKHVIAAFKAANTPVVRFMDYLQTNHSAEHCAYPCYQKWSDRRPKNYSVQSHFYNGNPHPYIEASWEYLIDFCNETDIDPWINIPVNVTDDYIRQLAQLFKTQLEPGRKIYTEYGNENWNYVGVYGYQADWIKACAAKEVSTNPQSDLKVDPAGNEWLPKNQIWDARRLAARRNKEIGEIFVEVFGPGSRNTTIRPLIMEQRGLLEAASIFRYISTEFGPVKDYFYASGGATYFGFFPDEAGISSEDDLFKGWTTGADYMGSHVPPPGYAFSENRALWKRVGDFTRSSALCKWYGIKSFAYEGSNGTEDSEPFYFTAHRSDRNIDLLKHTIGTMWHGTDNDLWMWFQFSIAGETQSSSFGGGNFGAVWYPQDTTHGKFRGIRELMNSPRAPLSGGIVLPLTLNQDTSIYIGDNLFDFDEARLGYMRRKRASLDGDLDYFLVNSKIKGTYAISYELDPTGTMTSDATIALMKQEAVLSELVIPAGSTESNSFLLTLDQGIHTLKFVPRTTMDKAKGWKVSLVNAITDTKASLTLSGMLQKTRIQKRHENLTIHLPGTEDFTVELFTVSGKRILRHRGTAGSATIALTRIPAGSYVMNLFSEKGLQTSYTFVNN